MTKAELVEALKDFPDNLPVIIPSSIIHQTWGEANTVFVSNFEMYNNEEVIILNDR